MILNIVFIVMSVYGMYVWKHPKTVEDKNGINELKIRRSSVYGIFSYSVTILIGTYLLGSVMSNIHNVFPKIFISPASYPYWDAFVTTSSIVAMYLMSKRLYDCWFLWFTLDVVCIVLFYSKGIQFISLLYFVFLFTAIIGLRTWWKVMKDEGSNETK
jgi:nicotinamide mononucleotide transporter